jgi:uncharacterized membrane protein
VKKSVFWIVIFMLACTGQVHAATNGAKTQQNRMKECAAEYHKKNIAKSGYHKFMSECLKKHPEKGTTDSKKK